MVKIFQVDRICQRPDHIELWPADSGERITKKLEVMALISGLFFAGAVSLTWTVPPEQVDAFRFRKLLDLPSFRSFVSSQWMMSERYSFSDAISDHALISNLSFPAAASQLTSEILDSGAYCTGATHNGSKAKGLCTSPCASNTAFLFDDVLTNGGPLATIITAQLNTTPADINTSVQFNTTPAEEEWCLTSADLLHDTAEWCWCTEATAAPSHCQQELYQEESQFGHSLKRKASSCVSAAVAMVLEKHFPKELMKTWIIAQEVPDPADGLVSADFGTPYFAMCALLSSMMILSLSVLVQKYMRAWVHMVLPVLIIAYILFLWGLICFFRCLALYAQTWVLHPEDRWLSGKYYWWIVGGISLCSGIVFSSLAPAFDAWLPFNLVSTAPPKHRLMTWVRKKISEEQLCSLGDAGEKLRKGEFQTGQHIGKEDIFARLVTHILLENAKLPMHFSWNAATVAEFLRRLVQPTPIDASRWAQAFIEADIDGRALTNLTDDFLKELGVVTVGQRLHIIRIVEALENRKLTMPYTWTPRELAAFFRLDVPGLNSEPGAKPDLARTALFNKFASLIEDQNLDLEMLLRLKPHLPRRKLHLFLKICLSGCAMMLILFLSPITLVYLTLPLVPSCVKWGRQRDRFDIGLFDKKEPIHTVRSLLSGLAYGEYDYLEYNDLQPVGDLMQVVVVPAGERLCEEAGQAEEVALTDEAPAPIAVEEENPGEVEEVVAKSATAPEESPTEEKLTSAVEEKKPLVSEGVVTQSTTAPERPQWRRAQSELFQSAEPHASYVECSCTWNGARKLKQ